MEDLESTRNQFAIIKFLGSGTSGFVFLVEKDGKQWAMKWMSREFSAELEVCFLKKFQGVDGAVVQFKEMLLAPNGAFVLMEYCRGAELGSVVIPQQQWISITIQLLKIMHKFRCMGVVHRDIKPQNIMASENSDATYKITVFDLELCGELPAGCGCRLFPSSLVE